MGWTYTNKPQGVSPERCTNANRGTYGHECGKPAAWAGTHKSGHVQLFCDRCKEQGDEARPVVTWRRLDGPAARGLALRAAAPMRGRQDQAGLADLPLFDPQLPLD